VPVDDAAPRGRRPIPATQHRSHGAPISAVGGTAEIAR